MYKNRQNLDEDEPHYYNVEKTDHPYVNNYVEAKIEDLSDNFKILEKSIYRMNIPILSSDRDRNNVTTFSVLDVDLVRETLNSYKEQLIADKNVVITDAKLRDWRAYYPLTQVVGSYLAEAGLTLKNDNTLVIRKERKPRNSTTRFSKYDINGYFDTLIRTHLRNVLGIETKFRITSKKLFTVLSKFQAVFPTVTYSDLTKAVGRPWYTTSDEGISINKRCEELWNNPKLAKQPKKATKKVSK